MNRIHVTKTILWSIVGLGAAVALTRFVFGLGATTNLTDATPWGLWIGFDVMAGVALAGGGFVITAIFYIMRRETFHPLVKPAVLTAFLGYMAVILSLLVDLGLPWNLWHMIIFWNFHSPLFEVGWCVMLYSAVLILEFSPVTLEGFSRWAGIRRVLMKFRFPLVLLGIMLSTLHQSSLGSLILIMPFKSHPLWYTNILPVLFFVSAVALGLMMVSFESHVTAWLYRRQPETGLVSRLCKAAIWVLGLYLIVRIGDIVISGKFAAILAGTWESITFLTEILIIAVIPIILFSIPRARKSLAGQWIGSFLVVFGMVFNRINTGGLTMLRATGDNYFPSWMEFTISASVISFMVLVFLFIVEHFNIWDVRPREAESDRHARPAFSRAGEVWLGHPRVAARTKYSMAFILALAVGLAIIPENKTHSGGLDTVAAMPARGGDTLFIDGNHDGYGSIFKHEMHVANHGQKQSCVLCHHMNLPGDKNSPCGACHRDMYQQSDAFRHDWHTSPDGANIACNTCHEQGLERTCNSAVRCDACHNDLIPDGTSIRVEQYKAPSYTDAMHGLCVTCHREKARAIPEKAHLTICSTCHVSAEPEHLRGTMQNRLPQPHYNHVVLPGVPPEED